MAQANDYLNNTSWVALGLIQMLADNDLRIDEFMERLGIRLDDTPDFETVAGLVLHRAARLPKVGEHVDIDGWRIEVVDMDGRRIDKLLVERRKT